MFLFPPIHFLKFLVKSQPQRSYKKGSYKKKIVQEINSQIYSCFENNQDNGKYCSIVFI